MDHWQNHPPQSRPTAYLQQTEQQQQQKQQQQQRQQQPSPSSHLHLPPAPPSPPSPHSSSPFLSSSSYSTLQYSPEYKTGQDTASSVSISPARSIATATKRTVKRGKLLTANDLEGIQQPQIAADSGDHGLTAVGENSNNDIAQALASLENQGAAPGSLPIPRRSLALGAKATKRHKIATACNRCRQFKRKCDQETPCSTCKRNQVECEYTGAEMSRAFWGDAPLGSDKNDLPRQGLASISSPPTISNPVSPISPAEDTFSASSISYSEHGTHFDSSSTASDERSAASSLRHLPLIPQHQPQPSNQFSTFSITQHSGQTGLGIHTSTETISRLAPNNPHVYSSESTTFQSPQDTRPINASALLDRQIHSRSASHSGVYGRFDYASTQAPRGETMIQQCCAVDSTLSHQHHPADAHQVGWPVFAAEARAVLRSPVSQSSVHSAMSSPAAPAPSGLLSSPSSPSPTHVAAMTLSELPGGHGEIQIPGLSEPFVVSEDDMSSRAFEFFSPSTPSATFIRSMEQRAHGLTQGSQGLSLSLAPLLVSSSSESISVSTSLPVPSTTVGTLPPMFQFDYILERESVAGQGQPARVTAIAGQHQQHSRDVWEIDHRMDIDERITNSSPHTGVSDQAQRMQYMARNILAHREHDYGELLAARQTSQDTRGMVMGQPPVTSSLRTIPQTYHYPSSPAPSASPSPPLTRSSIHASAVPGHLNTNSLASLYPTLPSTSNSPSMTLDTATAPVASISTVASGALASTFTSTNTITAISSDNLHKSQQSSHLWGLYVPPSFQQGVAESSGVRIPEIGDGHDIGSGPSPMAIHQHPMASFASSLASPGIVPSTHGAAVVVPTKVIALPPDAEELIDGFFQYAHHYSPIFRKSVVMMHLLSPNHSKEALYMFHNLLVAAYKHRGREGDLQRAINHCNAALALEEQGIRWTTLRIQGGILGNTLTNDILECVSSRVRHIAEGQCQLRCQPSLAYFNPINTKGDDGETSRPKALIQMLQLEPHKDDTFLPEAVYQTRLWLFWTMYVYDAKRALYYGWCSDVDPYATLPPLPSLRRLSMIDPLVSPNTTNQPRKGKRPLSQVLQEYDPSSWRGDIDNSNNDNNNSSSDNSNYKVSGTKDLKIELTSFDMSWIDQYQSVSAVIQPPPISTLNEMLLLQSMEPFKWPMDRDQAAAMRDPAIELVAYDRHMTRMIHWIEEDGDLTDGGTFSRIIFGFEARLWMIGRRVARYIARKRARRCRTAMGSDGVVAAAGSAAGTATSTMKRPAGVCRTACRPQLRPRTSTQSTASSSSSSTSIETRWTTDARWSQSAWASDDELQSIQAELVQWEQELPDPFRFRKDHHYPDVNHEVNGKMGQLVLYYYTIMLILHSSYLPIPASWNAEKRFRRCRRMMQSPTSSSPSEQPSSQSSLQESASSFFLSDDSDSPSPPPHASSPNAAPVASSANGNSNSNSEASCANQPQSCLPPPILSQLNGTGKLFSGEDKVSEVSDCTNIVDVPVTEVGSPSCSPSNMSPQLQHQPPQQQQQQSSSSLYFTTAHKQCTELAITLLHHIDQLLTRYPQWVRHDTHIENSIIIAVRVHLVNSKLGGLSRQDGVQGEGSTATTTLTDLSGVESAAGSAPAVSAADPMTTEPVVRDRFQELRREATSGFRLGSELSRKLKALRHPLEQLASSPSHGQAVVRSKDSTAAPNSAPIVTTTAIATTATPTEMSSAAPYANLMAESCQEEAKREHIDKGDEGGEGNSDECMKEIEDLRQRVHRMWSTKIRHYSRGRFKTTMEFSSTSSCSSTSRSQPKQEQEQQQEKQEQEQEQRQEPGQAPQLPERAAPGMIPGMSNANAESIGQVEQQLMTDPSLVSTSEDCPDCLSGMCLVHGTVEGEQPDHQMMRQLFPTDFSIEDYLMLGMDLENLDFDLDL